MRGKYLYGIIKKPKDTSEVTRSEAEGLLGRWRKKDGLSTVDYRSLSAVVAETERKDYHKLPKEETVRELISHQQTVEKIMEQFPILPVKFGTTLKNEEEVKSVLEKGYFFLCNTLRKIEDKIELDLVCFWNAEKAAQMAFQKSKKIRNYYKRITEAKTPREGVEDKISLGKLVADYLASKREKLRDQILKTLKRETVESCSHALADVNMLLNQAFLVEKNNEEGFNHTLNKLNSQLADIIDFRLVGPLPPYSFATVVIESLDEEEVEKAEETLGLDGEITARAVSEAYRKLAQEFHPDKNAGVDPLGFHLINSAYKLLKDFAEKGYIHVDVYRWEPRP